MNCFSLSNSQAPWQPVSIPQLISVGNFDASNKQQIAQIAHHNAHILRQIKGMHPPVTQYHNPFPIFPPVNPSKNSPIASNGVYLHSPYQNAIVQSQKQQSNDKFPSTQNLISSSSSNVAQSVTPKLPPLKNYVVGKPSFYGNAKPDFTHFKYFNGVSATVKGPSPPSFAQFSTTSRIPHIK